MGYWNYWFIVGIVVVIVGAVSYALGQDKEKRKKEVSERERRARQRRKDTEKNRGQCIKNALDQHNFDGKFDIAGDWHEGIGYEINVYRNGAGARKVSPMRIRINARNAHFALEFKTGSSGKLAYFPIDDHSIVSFIGIAKTHMDTMDAMSR
jgi:hypothetical protein